ARPPPRLGLVLLCLVLCGLGPFALSHLLVALGALLRGRRLLLVHALAPQRSVAGDVTGGLLAAAEELVEESHSILPSRCERSIRNEHKNARSDEPEGPSDLTGR